MKQIYKLSLLLLLLGSCTAPRVVTRMVPEAPEGHHANGREYIPLESEQITVELGYDGLTGDHLIFDFVVHNATMDTLVITPEDFYYVILDSADADGASLTPWIALHPDQVLMQYDQELEERREEKKVNSILGFIEAGVNILYNTTGFIATENPGYIADALLQTAGTADHYISREKRIQTQMEGISEEKKVVQEELFRTSAVPPDSVMSGYVFFPKHEATSYYMFCFPIQNQLFQFVYNQRRELVYL